MKLMQLDNLNHLLLKVKHYICWLDSKQHLQALWLPTMPKYSGQTPYFHKGTVTKPPALLLQDGDIIRTYVLHANNTLMPSIKANAHANYFLPVRCPKVLPTNSEKDCVTKNHLQVLRG